MTPKLKSLFDQATARPWNIYGYQKNDRNVEHAYITGKSQFDDSQVNIGKVSAETWMGSELRANAQLITLAANHFEAVVDALEQCVTEPGALAERNHHFAKIRLGAITEQARIVLAAIEKDAMA